MRIRRLVDHNPFLLLSAALVLAGGWLTAAGEGSPWRLLGLFGFIQLYEIALLGAAGFIERWVGPRDPCARRDAATLLALEVLFLGDLSFTNSVFPGMSTTGLELGIGREDLVLPLLAAALAIGLGPVKLALAARAGRIEWPRALYGYALFALVLIHGGPVLVLLSNEASNPAGAINALWWVVAFLPLVLTRAVAAGEGSMGPFKVARPTGVLAVGGALLVAAVAHVVSAGWANVVAFEPWHPAALLIGLAAAWPRLVPSRARERSTAGLSLVAASVAVLLASRAPASETLFLGPVETTPFRAVAALAALALADAARKTGRPRLLYAAVAAGVLAWLGPTWADADSAALVPAPSTKALAALLALAATIIKVDHLAASLVGLGAAWAFAGEVRDPWLFASFVSLHQLVLAHRHRSPAWMRLRTTLAWAALLTSLAAVRREVSLVDLYVVSLIAAAIYARCHGFGRGYERPATVAAVLLGGERVVQNAPRDRIGAGLLALGAGVAFLGAGLAFSIFRQRFTAWLDRAQT